MRQPLLNYEMHLLNVFCSFNFFLKKTNMKKSLFFAILGLALVLFAASCSKSGTTTPPASTTAEGKWSGFFTLLGPSRYYALTFKTGSVILVESTNSTTPDIANGTWSLAAADSIRATFTYVGGTASTYSIAGKYSSSSNVMEGTIGPGTSTTGAGTFIVTKE